MNLEIRPVGNSRNPTLYVVLANDRRISEEIPLIEAMRKLSVEHRSFKTCRSIIESGNVHDLNSKELICLGRPQ